jgi:hypothetical protein
MTRSSSAFLLRRAYEHLIAGAGAVALTMVLLLSVDARADSHSNRSVVPSVTILVPTVEIEVIGADTSHYVAAAGNDRVNG